MLRVAVAWLVIFAACEGKPSPALPAGSKQTAPAPVPVPKAPASETRPSFLPAKDGPVAPQVVAAAAAAKAAGKTLLVYVGADWCDPCTRFHAAVEGGELDGALPNLQFLEFDLDRDQRRLAVAGYQSRLIPLFALPHPNGHMAQHIAGGIKGSGSVEHILRRLVPLLDGGTP